MDNLNISISVQEWIQLFTLGMAILVFSSMVIMISLWIVSSKLTDIIKLLEKQNTKNTEDKND